jgi:predicted acetyltransferase
MQRAMEELHAQGVALSALYPATQSLYRKAGYEKGGCRYLITLPPNAAGVKERGAVLRAATVADRPAIAEAHTAYARRFNGHLDRSPYIWNRVYEHRQDPAQGYLVEEDGAVTGYVFYVQKPTPTFQYDLYLTDVVALTGRAARRILGFLADHGTMVPSVEWAGSPEDPLLMEMPEQPFRIRVHETWMERIVSVPGALAARGYPEGLTAKLEIRITDDVLPANTGRYVLTVSGGTGRVTPGGSGSLSLHVRGLAALYTGFHSPATLRAAGLLEGTEQDARLAEAVFRGGPSWTPDFF